MQTESELGSGEITALLGRDTEYRGKLTFRGRARLDGRFDGEVFSEGTLIVGEGAEVRGRIEIGTLIVLGGLVDAEVAAQLVEVHAAAHVRGSIETDQIFVERGATFEGRCEMRNMQSFEPETVETPVAPISEELDVVAEAFEGGPTERLLSSELLSEQE